MRTLITAFLLTVTFFSSQASSDIIHLEARDWHLADNSVMVNGTLVLVKEGVAIINDREEQWTVELNKLHWKDRSYIIEALPILQASSGFTAKDSTNLVFRLLVILLLVTVSAITMITTGDGGIRISTALFISTMLLCMVFTSCESAHVSANAKDSIEIVEGLGHQQSDHYLEDQNSLQVSYQNITDHF